LPTTSATLSKSNGHFFSLSQETSFRIQVTTKFSCFRISIILSPQLRNFCRVCRSRKKSCEEEKMWIKNRIRMKIESEDEKWKLTDCN
jgi:hypothetical protein